MRLGETIITLPSDRQLLRCHLYRRIWEKYEQEKKERKEKRDSPHCLKLYQNFDWADGGAAFGNHIFPVRKGRYYHAAGGRTDGKAVFGGHIPQCGDKCGL